MGTDGPGGGAEGVFDAGVKLFFHSEGGPVASRFLDGVDIGVVGVAQFMKVGVFGGIIGGGESVNVGSKKAENILLRSSRPVASIRFVWWGILGGVGVPGSCRPAGLGRGP